MSNNILKPANMKYKPNTPTTSSSIWDRLKAHLTGSTTTAREPVRVRLINDWHDMNFHRINIVVCNFLYEDGRWNDIEKATGLRREHIFYGLSAFLTFLILANKFTAILCLIGGIIIPTLHTLNALNDENAEDQKYWLRYWIIYGSFSFAEGVFSAIFPDLDFDYAKLLLLAFCFLPYYSSSALIFNSINDSFLRIRQKFQQYNYQIVE